MKKIWLIFCIIVISYFIEKYDLWEKLKKYNEKYKINWIVKIEKVYDIVIKKGLTLLFVVVVISFLMLSSTYVAKIFFYNINHKYNVPVRQELLFTKKYDDIEYIEDMWYLMIINSYRSLEVNIDKNFFIFNGERKFTGVDNFFIAKDENYNYGCRISGEKLTCYDREEDEENRINIVFNDGKYEIYKKNNEYITEKEKEEVKKFSEKLTKETNRYFKEYMKS